MERDSIEEAREFWERFDLVRGVRTVKDVAESIGISYELIRVQRTRLRTPRLYLAVSIAKERWDYEYRIFANMVEVVWRI